MAEEELVRFTDDEPAPTDRRRRWVAGGIGLLLLLLILGFLIWFIANHLGRAERDGTPFGIGRGTAVHYDGMAGSRAA